ncbi:WD40 repeat domain-containing protein [Paenibacillus apiarius]|uniref:WD40 repeat domain-containing protein n=1 Tax=Paenibacillus apiarius TaxID=46240 RepID=UPI00197F0EED|nr:WD40 repeat domain-containing protein [Paenibacillus apiarius]MBN3523014.1 WD40 repeat domain-containing protein [Paenibacillus apiarius]
MKKKRFILSLGILSLMLMLLSSCNLGPKTETIIIPSKEEEHTEDQGSRPFQVNKIYRLPDDFTSAGQLLGWTSTNSVVASYRKSSTDRMMIKRLTHPYEQSEFVPGIHMEVPDMQLSPDGKYICEISKSRVVLNLISLENGKETEVAKINSLEQLFVQDVAWSGNGRYLGYLVVDPRDNGVTSLGVYDAETQSSKTFKLKGIPSGNTILKINVSDDGRSVLLTTFQYDQSGEKNYIMMGTNTGEGEIEIQFEHQIGREQNAWINNNQFAFLGIDGTLYEYDRRNGELSVLLDKVGNFKFSHDKKSIAYSLYDQDIIYAGKIQGKNVLYNEPVYRGILPSYIYWSLDNNSLLIHGQKLFSPSQMTQTDSTVGQSFIIEFQ